MMLSRVVEILRFSQAEGTNLIYDRIPRNQRMKGSGSGKSRTENERIGTMKAIKIAKKSRKNRFESNTRN